MEERNEAMTAEEISVQKTCYLVDVENVGNAWIDYISKKEQVEVYLFFTVPCPYLSYVNLDTIMQACSKVTCFQCDNGKNAADFQLVSYLGYLIASKPACDHFIILSNDKDFECVCKFWYKKGYHVMRHSVKKTEPESTKPAPQPAPQPQNAPDEVAEKKAVRKNCLNMVKNTLPQNEKVRTGEILNLIEKYKSGNLQVIYQAFIKTYGQKNGLAFYNCVKPVIKEIQTMVRNGE